MRKWIAAAFALSLLAGCVTDRTFLSRNTSLQDAAHILTDSQTRFGSITLRAIYITEVDGKQTSNIVVSVPPTDVYLEPGQHTIGLLYSHNMLRASAVVSISVTAGTNYHVHHAFDGYASRFWITRDRDGAVVVQTTH
jgi:hypothetical protein